MEGTMAVVFGCTTVLCSHTHGSIVRIQQREAVPQTLRGQAAAAVLHDLTAQVYCNGNITQECHQCGALTMYPPGQRLMGSALDLEPTDTMLQPMSWDRPAEMARLQMREHSPTKPN